MRSDHRPAPASNRFAGTAPVNRPLLALLALALLGAAPLSSAEWGRGEASDPETGDRISGVVGENDRGYSLLLARDEAGGVRATFRLPAGDRDFLAESQPPRIAIDGGPTRQVPLAGAGLTWVAFPVWNGSGEALTGLLRELMQGRAVTVTYFLRDGAYKETAFSREGAAAAIAEEFGLRAEVGAEEVRQAAELEEALLREAERCGAEKGKRRDRCLDALRACAAKAKTAVELVACSTPDG